MEPLAKPLRRDLETDVVKARDLADAAARAALTHLCVDEPSAPGYLTAGAGPQRQRSWRRVAVAR